MAQMLTISEAAAVLRKSPKTVYTWTSKKRIPHLKVGGRVLFDAEELERWMTGFRVQVIPK